jgi:hypothetical protein
VGNRGYFAYHINLKLAIRIPLLICSSFDILISNADYLRHVFSHKVQTEI